jgi:hypothetical protein
MKSHSKAAYKYQPRIFCQSKIPRQMLINTSSSKIVPFNFHPDIVFQHCLAIHNDKKIQIRENL